MPPASVPDHPNEDLTTSSSEAVENRLDDATIQQFLAQSGLDSSVIIDPASLEALKELLLSNGHTEVTNKCDNNYDNTPFETNDSLNESTHVHARAKTNGLLQRDILQTEELINATAVEKKILNQLELQLGLLTDMQRQLETLSEKVQDLQRVVVGDVPTSNYTATTVRERSRAAAAPVVAQHNTQRQAVGEHAHVPRQRAAAANPPRGIWLKPRDVVVFIANTLYESRLSRIIRLFWRLQNQQVQNLDGGLLLKVLVIMAIFMARWTSSKRKPNSYGKVAINPTPSLVQFWDAYRFYIMVVFVGVGFMVQSGYLQFLYNFFIKENYPVRIWCGEDVDLLEGNRQQREQPHQHHQHQRGQQRQPQAQQVQRQPQAGVAPAPVGRGGANRFPEWNQLWGDGLMRLFIGPPPPPPQEQANDSFLIQIGRMIVRTLTDFFCLVLSFVLSIFPMVNLEGLRIPDAHVDNNNNNNPPLQDDIPQNHQPNGQPGVPARPRNEGNDAAPGQVQPPRDPAEPLDDDE